MNIQWFPGHMAKTKRMLAENLKMVDVVIELLDARIPKSSQNPDINELTGNRKRLIVLNKSDLADPQKNRLWKDWFTQRGMEVVYTNAMTGEGIREVKQKLTNSMKEKTQAAADKGRKLRPIKTMVVGIPNVGKSAFINRIAGKAVATTGDRPGVTRMKQWVRLNPQIQLMDTPGILWPRFDDPETGMHLAFTGAIRDEIMDVVTLAAQLMEKLAVFYPEQLCKRYKLSDPAGKTGIDLLEEAGRKRGCLISGGEVDQYRIAGIVLDEFRGAGIGRITLEVPEAQRGEDDSEQKNDGDGN